MKTLEERFEAVENDFLKTERIKGMKHRRRDIAAFLLISEIMPETDEAIIDYASHDEIWLNVDCEKFNELATDEQILTLVRCGIRYDSEQDSLCKFV